MSQSNIETEIKIEAASAEDARARLERAGFAVSRPRLFETNVIHDWPDGSIRASGRLLRLRSAGGGYVLTYKGQADKSKHKSREEIEVSTGDGANLAAILERLGLPARLRYEKHRTEYERPGENGVAMLDETPIGVYLELEGEPEWIDRSAAALGYDESSYRTDSYVRLYLEWCAARGVAPGDGMVFLAR